MRSSERVILREYDSESKVAILIRRAGRSHDNDFPNQRAIGGLEGQTIRTTTKHAHYGNTLIVT